MTWEWHGAFLAYGLIFSAEHKRDGYFTKFVYLAKENKFRRQRIDFLLVNISSKIWGKMMNWSEITMAVIAAIVAIVTGGIAIKKITNSNSREKKSTRIVSQKNNIAQGDIVAGDSIKNNTRQ